MEQITFGGSNWSTWGAGSISGLYTANTRIIAMFCTADTACTPRISGFDTAGTACTRGSVLLIHTPSTRSIWAFSTAHTPSARPI